LEVTERIIQEMVEALADELREARIDGREVTGKQESTCLDFIESATSCSGDG
jgi:hypothetical protein